MQQNFENNDYNQTFRNWLNFGINNPLGFDMPLNK